MAGSPPTSYRRIASLKTPDDFAGYLSQLGLVLQFDRQLITGDSAPLNQPFDLDDFHIGNRFCILPMEGWDGTEDGKPSDLTIRRWRHFGESGAKLFWGGEAVAVRHDGRANPRQLVINASTVGAIAGLREGLLESHREHFGSSDNMILGLQLTHSGRFCRPNDYHRLEPKILYHHPLLDDKFRVPSDYPLLSDEDIT